MPPSSCLPRGDGCQDLAFSRKDGIRVGRRERLCRGYVGSTSLGIPNLGNDILDATMSEMLFACPCCGNLTLDEQPPGTYVICEACDWEDDPVQFANPDLEGGANARSLNQQRTWHDQNARDASGNLLYPPDS